jgi:hypothetical protein
MHGHREVTLRWTYAAVPSIQVEAIIKHLVSSVANGTRYEAGQTLLLGGHLTRFVVDGDDLALEELDFDVSPLAWKPGVDQAMYELATQRFTAESYELLEAIDFARGDQKIVTCSTTRPGPFVLKRDAPSAPDDSGWFLGCVDRNHDHDAPDALVVRRIHTIISERPALARYLALPVTTSILMRSSALNVLYGEAWRLETEGSYMAELIAKGKAGTFELGNDLRAMIEGDLYNEAIDLCCERFLCGWSMAKQKVDAYVESLPKPVIDKGSLDAEIVALLQKRETIKAISRCREVLGFGLAEAKRYVDAIGAKLRRPD